jgi:two-component system sensor histidine kinase ChiS
VRFFPGQVFIMVLVFVLAILNFARENSICFEHISSEQGLSQDVVSCILQDSRGFMWFGTQDGLNRFDGYGFKKYKYNPKESASIPANKILLIYEDRRQNLWIGTEGGGLSCFNWEKENFIRYRYQSESDLNPGYDIDIVVALHEDRDGIFWVGTWGGLLRFDPVKRSWSRFVHKTGVPGTLSDNKIRTLCQAKDGTIWIGTEEEGLNAFDPNTGIFTHYRHDPKVAGSLSSNSVYALLEDSKRNLWIGTTGGLDRWEPGSKTFSHYRHYNNNPYSLSNDGVRAIFEDSKEVLWIGTYGGGLNRLKNFSKKIFIHYHHQPSNPTSLSHDKINFIREDRTGSLWIGTDGGGINRIDSQKQQFSHFYSNPNKPNSLSSNDISCFLEDSEGILWIGTYDRGLNRYNPAEETFRFYQYNRANPRSLSSNSVKAIYQDRHGALWIGTWGGGMNRFDRDSETFTRYRHQEGTTKGLGSNDIFCIYGDRADNLWIGTWKGGLNLFQQKTGEFHYYKNDPENPQSISSNGVTVIFPDMKAEEESLWIGTHASGLEYFNRLTGHFKHYSHDPANPHSISNNSVTSIYISPNQPGILWVGTVGGGLNRFDRYKNEWQFYTEEDGLSNNTILGILEDKNKNLWLSTIRGLSRFNPQNGKFTNYFTEDGLQSNEFSQGAYFKGRDGRLYFGGVNGFNVFYPDHIEKNSNPPPIVITAFNVPSREGFQLKKSILETDKITLSYKDTLSFEFAALNYIAPAKNSYKYKLEGSTLEDWVLLGHKREITFPALPHGEYVFRVKGSNNDGVWSLQEASIKLIITPPFYKKLWFTSLLVALLAGALLLMYKLRIRRYKVQRNQLEIEVAKRTTQLENSNRDLKKSEMELRELNATKDKFFSIISHDLRNHLTSLLGYSDMLYKSFAYLDEEKKQKYSRSIDKSARDLYELLENLLHWARNQTGALLCRPKAIDLGHLIPETVSAYTINAKKKNIDISCHIEKETVAYADHNMVRTVLRNLVSNAIKFTDKGGDIQVKANGKNGFIEIAVFDSGVGIQRERKDSLFKIGKNWSTKGTGKEHGTGLGLILCKEFVEKNNGTIWVESPPQGGNGKGSVFRFTLPTVP